MRGDAEEACWAHNPEVGGSKPSLAKPPLNRRNNTKLSIEVAQGKRVGPITQRSEDRNLLSITYKIN